MAGFKISDDSAFPPKAVGTLDGTENIPLETGTGNAKTSIVGAASYRKRTTVTASTYTVQPEDDIVEINTGTCTVTLPALAGRQKPVTIVKISSTAGTVTINRAGSDVITRASLTSVTLTSNGDFWGLTPRSSRWELMAGHEIGSNANGTYYLYADGTQNCEILATENLALSTPYGSLFIVSRVWTFPKQFIATPRANGVSAGLSGQAPWGSLAISNNTTGIIRITDVANRGTVSISFSASATGRWYT